MIGRSVKDAYGGALRDGVVIEDHRSHWLVDWGRNQTRIRKDRVGNKPKAYGPWWADPEWSAPEPSPLAHTEDASEPKDHYILDARACVGNCCSWWRPDGKGYTCELDQAGLYTKTQAESHRGTDVPVHKDLAESMAIRHVRLDQLRAKVRIPR